MRWYLTDSAPELEAALRAAGEEIVSTDEDRARLFVENEHFHPQDYPLAARPLGRKAEVVVLVDPIRTFEFGPFAVEFGYARGHGRTLRNRGVTLVMYAAESRKTLDAFRAGMHRRCACEINDAGVHVVPDASVGDIVRGSRRVAVWAPGQPADAVINATRHARSGQIYLPRRDGRLWG